MKLLVFAFSLLVLIGFNSCKSKKANKLKTAETNNVVTNDPSIKGNMSPDAATQPRNFLAEGYTKGWVRDKTGLDGCSYLIQLEDSSFIQPNVLSTKFQEDNKKVWFKYTIKKGAMSTCMSGKLVEIIDIVDRWYE